MDDLLSRAPEEWAERIARRLSQRLFQEQPEVARRLFGRAAADQAAEEGASLSAEEFEATLAASVAESGELWAIHSGAPLRATGGAQRPAQMARELARRATVCHANAFEPRAVAGTLFRCRPDFLLNLVPRFPLPSRRGGGESPRCIGIVSFPDRAGLALARAWQEAGWTLIYDCLDLWRAFQGVACSLDWEEEIVGRADLVTVSARRLEEWVTWLGARRVVYLPNAATPSRWLIPPVPPEDLQRGPLTAIYVGYLAGEWFDWNLLEAVAERGRAGGWEVNVIGEPPGDRPTGPNLHYLGAKPYEEVGGYLHFSDVGLIPFVENLLTDCVSPLKVYDYLAAGLPVVSTPMSELRGIPYCHLASGAAAFCAAVAEASQERVDPAVIERFCRDHSWARRVARLRQELGI